MPGTAPCHWLCIVLISASGLCTHTGCCHGLQLSGNTAHLRKYVLGFISSPSSLQVGERWFWRTFIFFKFRIPIFLLMFKNSKTIKDRSYCIKENTVGRNAASFLVNFYSTLIKESFYTIWVKKENQNFQPLIKCICRPCTRFHLICASLCTEIHYNFNTLNRISLFPHLHDFSIELNYRCFV